MAKTLLLADDSVTIQKVVNISFASEDVTLLTVDNGDDAVTRAREVRPDVILADVVMPGLSGYEVCEAIKADPNLAHIPVLLLTGTFESFDEERAARVGAAGHVAKPFEAQTLVAQVKELLAAAPPPAPPPAPAITDTPPIVPTDATTAPAGGDANDSDSFDFFDDDLADLVPAAIDAPPADVVIPEDTDSAFAFVGDEMSAAEEPASDELLGQSAPAPDHTVAMIIDEPLDDSDPLDDSLLAPLPEPSVEAVDTFADAGPVDFGESDPLDIPAAVAEIDPEEPDDSFSPMAPAILENDAFDFSPAVDAPVDEPATSDTALDEAAASVELGDMAHATVLDPNGASSYDVSSSDLGMPLLDEAPLAEDEAAAPLVADEAADWIDAEPTPRFEIHAEQTPSFALDDEPAAAVFDDEFAPLDEPFPAPPLEEPSETAARPLPAAAAADAESLLAEIAPALREELHDTLEKMAWESFGAVTEKIVSETVDRVEKIAWEVIPQLAESIIREEIRRLKGEDEG